MCAVPLGSPATNRARPKGKADCATQAVVCCGCGEVRAEREQEANPGAQNLFNARSD